MSKYALKMVFVFGRPEMSTPLHPGTGSPLSDNGGGWRQRSQGGKDGGGSTTHRVCT